MSKGFYLPKKYKKDILKFAREYEKLANRHVSLDINIKITKKFNLIWESDWSYKIKDLDSKFDLFDYIYVDRKYSNLYKYNKEIETFCVKTEKWGQKHFNNIHWLWENVFWNYAAEKGEGLKEFKITWEDSI